LGNYTEKCHIKCEMKALWMDPGVRELAALSALAALGCGLAAARGDLLFVAIFGAACAVTIIEAIDVCSEIIGRAAPIGPLERLRSL